MATILPVLLPVLPPFAAAPDGGVNPMGTIFMFVAIFAIFYFLLIRPQRQQQKQHEEMVTKLARGDEVVTIGGIVGKIIHLEDDILTIRTAGDTRLEVERGKIGRVLSGKKVEGSA